MKNEIEANRPGCINLRNSIIAGAGLALCFCVIGGYAWLNHESLVQAAHAFMECKPNAADVAFSTECLTNLVHTEVLPDILEFLLKTYLRLQPQAGQHIT